MNHLEITDFKDYGDRIHIGVVVVNEDEELVIEAERVPNGIELQALSVFNTGGDVLYCHEYDNCFSLDENLQQFISDIEEEKFD